VGGGLEQPSHASSLPKLCLEPRLALVRLRVLVARVDLFLLLAILLEMEDGHAGPL